jgi:hypothetical protein
MANLRIPRVRVFWGDINLTSYDPKSGPPEVFTTKDEKRAPIIYDISVTINAEGEGPTGEFKWDPTAKGFAAYEYFVLSEEYMKKQITVEYFYPDGKKIVFVFVWAGQNISYGNNMEITVKLVSELAGLINANVRSTAQAHDEDKGANFTDAMKKTQKQYGLEESKSLLKFSKPAETYANKATLISQYNTDSTFGANIANTAKQMGAATFASNINEASVIIFAPYSYKGAKEDVIDASSLRAASIIDPSRRYGYILGPSIFDSLTRNAVWKPPQQDNNKTPASQLVPQKPAKDKGKTQNPTSYPQEKAGTTAAKPTSSPLGITVNKASSNIQALNNPEAPDRQKALNNEKAADLQMTTFLCPLLVGIKPYDILFIPSLAGNDFIEDWIVDSVSYTQNNGKITVGIGANRIIGTGKPMQKEQADKFKAIAEGKNLIGPNASLESWEKYAWGSSTPANSAPDPPDLTKSARGGMVVDM